MATKFIYGLHAGDGQYRYIGRTNDPAKRLYGHRSDCVSSAKNSAKNIWLREIGPDKIHLDVLLEFEDSVDSPASDLEKEYIDKYMSLGFQLVNVANRTKGSGTENAPKTKRYLKGHHTMYHYDGVVLEGCPWCEEQL